MSLDEVRRERETLRIYLDTFGWGDLGLVLFFTNDNSDYAGVYLAGPLARRVAIVPHEEVSVAPKYQSVRSFLQALLEAAAGGQDYWGDMVPEYTPEATFSPELSREDWEAARALWPLYEAARDADRARADIVSCILALMPPEQTDSVMGLLSDPDRDVASQAIRLLGRRRWEAAVPHLARYTEAAMQFHCSFEAIAALGEIGTPGCREVLRQAATRLPAPSFGHGIGEALARCGCEYRYAEGHYEYREPGTDWWQAIGV
jgi:hypothetical protein